MEIKPRASELGSSQILSNILNQIGIAAFKLNEDTSFSPVSEVPEWFVQLYDNNAGRGGKENHYYFEEAFPFVANFIFDAEKVWGQDSSLQCSSGIWTEVQGENQELFLEAIAINADCQSILLIKNETKNFDVRHKVFQTARDIALENEKLECVVQRHQRQLHQQLASICKQPLSFKELNKNIEQEASAVLICRQDGSAEVYNKALIDIYSIIDNKELERKSLLEKWVREAEKLYPEIHTRLEVGKHWEGEFETLDNDASKKWIRLMIAPVTNENNEILHYICIANDISDIKISLSDVENITQVDSMTGLPNRRSFWRYLTAQIDLKKHQGGNLALYYVDLDHFKQINDDLGPDQADFLLNTVASRLKRCLKKRDFIAHLGADEFAIVTTEYSDFDSHIQIAQRIVETIYREVSFNELTLNVSASVGIAVYPQHGLNSTQIVKSADYAMYHAKEMGRNQFQMYNPSNVRTKSQNLRISQGIKNALERKEFELLYQPQICMGSDNIHRAEALIRWNHPSLGVVSPEVFIPVAEDLGLIVDIGRWVIREACKGVKQLSARNLNVKVGVNVSPKQFKNLSLVDDIVKALNDFSIDPKLLELEVTESAFIENMNEIIIQLEKIRSLGVSISLDDFGTGYSSLSYLKNLPADKLKIDRSFISELPDNKQSKTIVESLIKMAHELSIEVIAEGVENESQLNYLKMLSCDYVQGYFFHAPLSEKELLALYGSVIK